MDELIGFTAGLVIGADGLSGIAPLDRNGLAQAPRYVLKSNRKIGDDVLHIWQRAQA